jgi:hypothetical protein
MFNEQNLDQIQNIGIPTFALRSGGRTEPFSRIFPIILPYVFGIAGIILLLNIITSGFKMMTSAGDPKALQAAQAKLTTSLIGIIILFVSFWIVNLIMQFFGINFTGGNLVQ